MGQRSWRESGHLLLLPAWSAIGEMESVLARVVLPAEPKAIWPFVGSGSARGLVFANEAAVAMLRGWPEGDVARLVIAEGVPDWLTWAALWTPTLPVIGIAAGGWTSEVAARIPDGATVDLCTHADEAGERYAATVRASLAGRAVKVRRLRTGGAR